MFWYCNVIEAVFSLVIFSNLVLLALLFNYIAFQLLICLIFNFPVVTGMS